MFFFSVDVTLDTKGQAEGRPLYLDAQATTPLVQYGILFSWV